MCCGIFARISGRSWVLRFRQFIGDNERTNRHEVLEVSDGLKTQRINELLHRELDHQSGGAVVFCFTAGECRNLCGLSQAAGMAVCAFPRRLGAQ